MTVITVACMDMLHEGHANLLRAMARLGTPVVELHSDRAIFALKGRFPVQPLSQRIRNVYDTGIVKQGDCYPIDGPDPSEWVEWVAGVRKPVTFMRGDDMADFPARAKVEELGIPVVWHPYTRGVSSTQRRDECA